MRRSDSMGVRSKYRLLVVLLGMLAAARAGASLRVDLNPDNGRADVRSAEWENWPVRDGVASESRKFGDVTVTLRMAGTVGEGLTANWWKPGLDYPARMASDGAYVKGGDRGGRMEMVISGLSPGGRPCPRNPGGSRESSASS